MTVAFLPLKISNSFHTDIRLDKLEEIRKIIVLVKTVAFAFFFLTICGILLEFNQIVTYKIQFF